MRNVEQGSTSVEMGPACQPQGCVMEYMTVKMEQMKQGTANTVSALSNQLPQCGKI